MKPTVDLAIARYWDDLFNTGTCLCSAPGFSLVVNPQLDPARRAMLMQLANGTARAVLSPQVASAMELPTEGAPCSLERVRAALRNAGVAMHAPDVVHYPAAGTVLTARQADGVVVRQLGPEDSRAFDAFMAQAPAQDQDDAFVELAHWVVFGAFANGELLAAASMYPWGGAAIADMGVLTLPHARGRGLARCLVQAMDRHAQALGHVLQYRCQHDNTASKALAGAVGLVPYATWDVAC